MKPLENRLQKSSNEYLTQLSNKLDLGNLEINLLKRLNTHLRDRYYIFCMRLLYRTTKPQIGYTVDTRKCTGTVGI